MTVLWKQKQDSKHNNCFPRTPSHWYWDSVWGRTEQFRVDKILCTKLHRVLYFVRRDKSSVTRSKPGKHLTHSNSEHSIKSNAGDSLWFSPSCDSPEDYAHFKGSLTQNKPSQNWVTRSWMLLWHLFSEQKTHCTTQVAGTEVLENIEQQTTPSMYRSRKPQQHILLNWYSIYSSTGCHQVLAEVQF